MRKREMGPALVLLCVLLSFPSSAVARIGDPQVTRGEGPVEIQADELVYVREDQVYEGHGHVEVVRGNLTLRADHARLNAATKDLSAWGNVVLVEDEDLLECERIEVNLDTRLGKVTEAKLFIKAQNFHITGKEAEKLGENRYRVRNGSFTTCDAKHLGWKFTASEMEVTLEGTGIVKDPTFYFEDIPLLYFPVGAFPVKRERQTGFLIPEVGYSSEDGLDLRTAFYWAIAKDMDATVYLEWLTERGVKPGLEYRYAFARETEGKANFYYINDREYDGNRYAFFYQHRQKFPHDFYLKGDINYVSDDEYTRDFEDDLPRGAKIDSRSLRTLRSVLFGGKNWDRFSLLADGFYFEDLTQKSNDAMLQILPGMSFVAHPQPLYGNLVFWDMSTSYTNFWREEGVSAHRWDIFPSLSLPVRLFDVVKLNGIAGFRETLYHTYNDSSGAFEDWGSRETFEAGVDASMEFFRVYGAKEASAVSRLFNVGRWMHTVEPVVSYRYRPRVNQDDFPFFDALDRIPYTNEITYGFTTRLLGKPVHPENEVGVREFLHVKISQSYSLGDPYLTDQEDKERDFSNIRGEWWWRFSPFLTGQGDVEFNPYDGEFERLNGILTVRDRRSDAAQIEYRNTKDQIEEINFYTKVKTINPLYLFLVLKYNLEESAWVERIYGIEYQAQCWSLGLVVDNIAESPDGTQEEEWKIRVYLNLLGVGSIGSRKDAFDL